MLNVVKTLVSRLENGWFAGAKRVHQLWEGEARPEETELDLRIRNGREFRDEGFLNFGDAFVDDF